jgi:hypothetical protein
VRARYHYVCQKSDNTTTPIAQHRDGGEQKPRNPANGHRADAPVRVRPLRQKTKHRQAGIGWRRFKSG